MPTASTTPATSQDVSNATGNNTGGKSLLNKEFLDCIHCGFCLPVCPTYNVLGVEMDSPRGRIWLMRSLADGRIPLSQRYIDHMYLCLECLACETACPSGVQYGHLMELARDNIESTIRRPLLVRLLRKFAFEWLLPSRRVTRLVLTSVWLYSAIGMRWFVARTRILRLFSAKLESSHELLPKIPRGDWKDHLGRTYPAEGEEEHRVGLLLGCAADFLVPEITQATIRVLNKNGVSVVIPRDQTCCAALQVHSGALATGRELALRNMAAFSEANVEVLISNAAGCGAQLKNYGELFTGNDSLAVQARAFSEKVRDINEFLADLPLNDDLGELPLTVGYHDACHLAHGQGIRTQPRELLRRIPGLELKEIVESDWCCGSAGVYNIVQPEMANRLLDRKLDNFERVDADVMVAANVGCILQLRKGIKARGLKVRVCHPVELLDEAYGNRVK